ncbi:MAG: PRC-barrel domain-containing protein [Proteobacteria bacterium]|nr:PRC-barrel domain-containing protein [Pseudomonadota bacterium]
MLRRVILAALFGVLGCRSLSAQTSPTTVPTSPPPGHSPAPGLAPGKAGALPSVTVLGSRDVQGILGGEVRTIANESMGRIVDVIVDGEGRPRAAIIDFGGFLGVGSRKIAVDWKALHFVPAASKRYGIVLELSREQVKAAPEYKEGQPIVVLGASGNLEPLP